VSPVVKGDPPERRGGENVWAGKAPIRKAGSGPGGQILPGRVSEESREAIVKPVKDHETSRDQLEGRGGGDRDNTRKREITNRAG